MDAFTLARLSSLLDQALDLEVPAREGWLAGLGGEDAALSTQLRELLARHATRETADLLDSGPAFTLPAQPGAGGEFQAGDRVGPFRLLEPLGRGGMGEVWRAERDDGQLKRQVALKLPMLAARRSVLAQRFARERDIVGALAHPHIARLYDAGIADDGQPWLALEVVDGRPIDDWCHAQSLDARARIELLQQVLQAVQHAHANLVIHRDLKPGNVLVTPQGQAMLLDFGIAKLLAEDEAEGEETELTRVGGRAMSLQHAAPEQVSGAPISIATDVWALGVLLYELLAGRLPFVQGTRSVLEQQILHDDPPRPSVLGGALRGQSRSRAGELDTIVLKALKKAPAERYATVNALADDLQRWLDHEPVLAQPDSRWYRTSKFVARNKAAVATAAAVSIVVFAASAISIRQAQVAQQQTRIAQTEARTAQAVQEFLEGIFKANSGDQADPIKARQRTAKELLDEGAARIEKGLADVPQAKARILRTLADMYTDLGQNNLAASLSGRRASLVKGYADAGSAELVIALADWADSLAHDGKEGQAAEVIAEAEAQLASATRPDDLARASVDIVQAGLRQLKGQPEVLPFAERAVALLSRQPPSGHLLQALEQQAEGLRIQRRPDEARRVLQDAMAIAPRVPGGETLRMSSLQVSLARLEAAQGKHAQAQAAFDRAIELAQSKAGEASLIAVTRRLQYGRYLVNAGRPRDAVAALQRARAIVEAWPAEAPERLVHWPQIAVLEAAALNHYGHPAQALELISRSGALVDQVASSPFQAVAWLTYRADAEITLGRFDAAEHSLLRVREVMAKHGLETSSSAYIVEQAQIKLEFARGRFDAAEQRRAAIDLSKVRKGVQLWSDGVRADILLARGECAAAEAVAASARKAVGNDTADARTAARLDLLRGQSLSCLGRPQEAAPLLQAAILAIEPIEDPAYSLLAARARLDLAELHARSRPALARDLVAQAAAAIGRHPQVGPDLSMRLKRMQSAVDKARRS